jgi:hypothetical protein
MPRTKKAGSGGGQRPATKTTTEYTLPQPPSRGSPRIPPRPEPRKPARPGLREALGLLVLMLSGRALDMPTHTARQGWSLTERWLRELVDVRVASQEATT